MIAMIAAIADKKSSAIVAHMETTLQRSQRSYGNRTDPGFPKVQISKHFLSIFNFIQVIELNNEYETTEIKLKPRRKFVA